MTYSIFIAALALLTPISTASSVLTPPVLPLFVRNPYLSTWLPSARQAPWEKWPMFWTGEYLGFGVLASVQSKGNNTIYPLLGRPHDSLSTKSDSGYHIDFPIYQGAKYDASVTNLTYHIPSSSSATEKASPPVEIVLSFFCPITPTSTLRQSIPACYLSIHAEGSFDVSIYVDLNGQWVSGDRNSEIEWKFIQNDLVGKSGIKTWKVKKRQEALFSENADRAEWGSLYFSGPSDFDHECGTSALVRQAFSSKARLQNRVDPNFRTIMDEEPIFAFSKTFSLSQTNDTSTQKTRSDHALFTIAHIQDPVAQYASARGLTLMRPLWKSWFLSDPELLEFHYTDFSSALALAQNYSSQLSIDAYKSGSSSYVDIVALSARQVMGGTSFAGTPDNPILFLKEISSDGNCQTVDVIFPSAPFFLYTNPRWLAYMLEPLLEHQLSGQYPNKYSMHDLGASFPNNTGHADGNDEYMPVEECGNMLILALALANSLKHESSSTTGSTWSKIGSTSLPSSDFSVFPLHSLTPINGISHQDDTFGGSTGDKGVNQAKAWLSKSYSLWTRWTSYLVEFSLEPHNQLSTDDFAGWLALQTNLALKGIVGIKAMAEIASILGHEKDAKHYTSISERYIKKWQEFGISRDGTHAKLAYNWYGSWTTLYSLFADALLCFHPSITSSESSAQKALPHEEYTLVSQHQAPMRRESTIDIATITKPHDFIPHGIYQNQSSYYAQSMQKYGLPLDSRHLYTKSDWQFAAAAVAEPAVRKEILDRVARWINETETDKPLTDLYETEGNGGFPEGLFFMARPVVGGHFAFLALERAC